MILSPHFFFTVDEKYVNDEFTHDKDSLILIINSNDGHFIEHNYALNNFSKTVDNACTGKIEVGVKRD